MKANEELRRRVEEWMKEYPGVEPTTLAQLASAKFRLFHEPKWLDEMAVRIAGRRTA